MKCSYLPLLLIGLCIGSVSAIEPNLFTLRSQMVLPQAPESKGSNLKGVSIRSTSLTLDGSYGWYLDKDKEKTLLLSTFEYANQLFRYSLDKKERQRIKTTVPIYLYDIHDQHSLSLSLFLNRELPKAWSLGVGLAQSVSSDFKGKVDRGDFNTTLTLMMQKEIRKVLFGLGAELYLYKNRTALFPLVHFEYATDKVGFELTPPLFALVEFYPSSTSTIQLHGEILNSGYSVNYKSSESINTVAPDNIQSTGLDVGCAYDRQITGPLRFSVGTGFRHQELTFREEKKELKTLTLGEGIFVDLRFYCTL